MFRSKEFQRSVMPLIIANSIFCTGLLEYFVDRIIRTIGFFYVICCLAYYSILYFTLKDVINILLGFEETKMTEIMTKFTFFYNIFTYVIAIFAGLLRRKRIKLFVQQLETCTRKIDEMTMSRNNPSLFRYQCIASIILFFITSGLIAIDIFWTFKANCAYNLKIWFYFYDNYPLIITMIIDFTFVFWIRYIKIQFGQLNEALLNMLTTTADSPQHKRILQMKDNWEEESSLSIICGTYKTNENIVKLIKVKQIHLELIKCARIINEAYGLQILISMSTSVIHIITLLYNLYVISITNEYDYWIKQFFAHFYWIFIFVIKIIAVNNICETTITENENRNIRILIFLIFLYAVNSGDILYELYEPSTSKKFRNEIHNFTFQQIQNRLTFTACGLFDLDHTFIYNAIGSITTYLVILIQVGGKPKILFNNVNYNSSSMI